MKFTLTQLNPLNYKFLVIIPLVFLGLILISSCKKTEVPPRFSSLIFEINHNVDGESVSLDPFQFSNDAGNLYTITDYKYYLSNIQFISNNGEIYTDPAIHLVDIKKNGSCSFLLDSIPPGTYTTLSFDLGLDSIINVSNGLLNSIDNINMAWPDMLGGGYHFLKFEGKTWINNSINGFAIHLGKNPNKIHFSFPIHKKMIYWNEKLVLHHNINEWFKNPLSYNFELHELYTMDNDSVMQVIKNNGKDVFSF